MAVHNAATLFARPGIGEASFAGGVDLVVAALFGVLLAFLIAALAYVGLRSLSPRRPA